MVGDERVRFCNQCNLHVYNLSGMTRGEAETLVTNSEGRLCIRFYRRADGTILTRNCPVGLRAIKQRVARRLSAALTAVLSFFAGFGLVQSLKPARETPHVMGVIARPVTQGEMAIPPSHINHVEPVGEWMGGMAVSFGEPATPIKRERPKHWSGKAGSNR
jgi:hypothetical protein